MTPASTISRALTPVSTISRFITSVSFLGYFSLFGLLCSLGVFVLAVLR